MRSEFCFRCPDGSAPALLAWLQSHGINGSLSVQGADEVVEIDTFGKWPGEQAMRLAHLLMERMTDVAAVKLLQLREELFVNSASSSIAVDLRRIADHFDPPPPDKVGSEYVAQRLGCTTTWIADLVRREDIPKSCIVPGTGNGKPWKFHRSQIDKWIENR